MIPGDAAPTPANSVKRGVEAGSIRVRKVAWPQPRQHPISSGASAAQAVVLFESLNCVARSSNQNIVRSLRGRSTSHRRRCRKVDLSRRRIGREPSPTREPRPILRRIL
jgi:hypothetical protein